MFASKRNTILISAAAVLLMAMATVAVLWALNGTDQVEDPDSEPVLTLTRDDDEEVNVADTSEDYGACDVTSTQAIKDELGAPAANVQSEHNLGVAGDAGGTAQICFYPFDSELSMDNGLNVEVSQIDEAVDLEQELELVAETSEIVEDLGDAAFYYSTDSEEMDDPVSSVSFNLIVYVDDARYTISIYQPADAVEYSDDEALTALSALAARSNLLN